MHKILDLSDVKLCSINRKYNVITIKGKPRLFTTKEYKCTKNLITLACRKVKINPPYMVRIDIKCYADIDASVKPILDGIEAAGVIDTDKNVLNLQVSKTIGKQGKGVDLKVYIDECPTSLSEIAKMHYEYLKINVSEILSSNLFHSPTDTANCLGLRPDEPRKFLEGSINFSYKRMVKVIEAWESFIESEV